MLNISRRDLDDAYKSMRDAHGYIQRYKEAGENVTGTVVRTLAVSAGALAVGVASGRYGALQVNGSKVPLDLAGGVALHAAAFFGLAGKYGEHLHSFADGALAAYFTKFGIGYGTELRTKAGLPPAMTVAGEEIVGAATPPQMGAKKPLTEAELAAMAHSVR